MTQTPQHPPMTYEQLQQSHDEWRMLAMHNYGVAKAAEEREQKLIDIMYIIAFESDDERTQKYAAQMLSTLYPDTPAQPAPKTEVTASSIDEWHEDHGDVLWWTFPIEESPYCGSPLDVDWPGYHTHWTPLVLPAAPAPKEGNTE